ncbi:hypothetical protein ACJIZ3_011251 [Penstemon smallii]|uniref:Tr-type G domain-containing protein n=1 Tax=Penstemon smallii TaxID=265156 RepID=A0ABD3UIM3_9LAMI
MDEEFDQQISQPTLKAPKFEAGYNIEVSLTSELEQFVLSLMSNARLVRNIALVGHLQHGKTTFVDMLVNHQHARFRDISSLDHNIDKHLRSTTRLNEEEREISIKAVPMSLVFQSSNSKSYLCNIMDTPGHVDFSDEMTAALRLADGAVLIVDAAEGVMLNTERAIQHAIQERIPIVVVLNKVDRLIDELRLPPNDAYDKLRDTIKVINNHITAASSTAGNIQVVDPALGNVCFASASSGWSFTLQSFAKQYVKVNPVPFDANELASHLWGDFFFNHVNKEFNKKKPTSEAKLSFVQFVLEPLYKLHSQVIKEDKKSVEAAICELGSTSTNADYHLSVSSTFDSACGFTDMLVEHIPSAKKAALQKVEHIYTGPKDSAIYEAIEACDTLGPTMVNITKMYPKSNGRGFDAFGRVFSGEITTGQTVQVLGEDYSPSDEEHRCMQDKKVTKLWIYLARHRVRISKAVSGSWVLIEGVDNSIMKTATLCSPEYGGDVHIFRPLQFNTLPVVKVVVEVATEPLNTSEVLEMKMGLTNVNKSYPLAIIEFKESGRHTISGSGEVYLDSIMRELTELCSKVELKFGDPFVLFCATAMDTSSIECFAESPNKKNKITMIAEPLDSGLADDCKNGTLSIDWSMTKIRNFLRRFYPHLGSQPIWEFGPDKQGPNLLIDHTSTNKSKVDKTLLKEVKVSIINGFQSGCLVGPLGPIVNMNFIILDAKIARKPSNRGFHEITSMVRRAVHSAFLTAIPRLMEPMYRMQIHAPIECESVIFELLHGRHISKVAQPWGRFCIFEACLPVIKSFGFEKKLRQHTKGQAHCSFVFDRWRILPYLDEMEDWSGYSMEGFSMKTCFDEPMLSQLAEEDPDLYHQLMKMEASDQCFHELMLLQLAQEEEDPDVMMMDA